MKIKNVFIYLIKCYQKVPGNFHNSCKFIPTCSNYAIESIDKYGCIKGLFLTIKRVLRCNPLSKGGYDPVKERKRK